MKESVPGKGGSKIAEQINQISAANQISMLSLDCPNFLFVSGEWNRGITELKILLEQICFKQASQQQKQIKKGDKSLKRKKRIAPVHRPAHLVQVLLLRQLTPPFVLR